MRMRHTALVAVCALLSTIASAGPPSDSLLHHPRAACADTRQSRWRTLSSRLIESIWRPSTHAGKEPNSPLARPDTRLPSHSLARYGGDVVLRFNITTADEAGSMAEAADTLLLDVWEFSKDWVDVRLSKDIVPSLLGLLPSSLQHSYAPLLRERELIQAIYDTYPSPNRDGHDSQLDVQASHLRGRPFSHSLQPNGAETNIFFSDYQPLSVIQPWMRLLASLFTTHVRLINIGYSYQGREIPALRVGVHPTNDEDPEPSKRKTVLITGGLHAREWIGTATVNYVAYSLVTAYGKNPHITRLLEDFDFVFVPTLNPDGYVYTWETDRLWRKNRQQTNVRFCPGIDLDRGFGYQWDGRSTAANPCSEAFAGEEPFEAVEATRLAEWARNETDNNNVEFVGFLDLHSYSQEILYPYSYTCDFAAPGQENLEELALGLEKTIRLSSGQIYEAMAACEGNFAAAAGGGENLLLPRIEDSGGSALDWFYHTLHVRYAYQIKLRDRGTYGFLLPRENIVPTGNEIWEAVLYFASFLSDVFVAENAGAAGVKMDEPDIDGDAELSAAEQKASIVQFPISSLGEEDSPSADEEWIWVEDVPADDVEWELRRRRRR